MHSFALYKLDVVQGKQTFYYIEVDGNSEFINFCNEIKGNRQYKSELLSLFARMNSIANLESLPKTKFRNISPDKELVKEYEFKTKNLRAYAIKNTNGKIIICAGFKTSQEKDLRHFRNIKKKYLNSIKEEK